MKLACLLFLLLQRCLLLECFSFAPHSPYKVSFRPKAKRSLTSTYAANDITQQRKLNILVGGVFSLTGQEVSRQLGRSKVLSEYIPGDVSSHVSALVEDPDLMALISNDNKHTLAYDKVSPQPVNNAAFINALYYDAVVISTDAPPPVETVKRMILDASSCGAKTVIMLSRSPPSGDLRQWRLAEDAATEAAASSSLRSLIILRTAELLGGPYYALNIDLLQTATAKAITSNHRDFAIAPAEQSGGGKIRQKDFGTSRPMLAKVLEMVLALQLKEELQPTDGMDSENSAAVSILDVVSVEGISPDADTAMKRVATALKNAATTKIRPKNTNENTVSTNISPPFSDSETLSFLTSPQQQYSTNPFLAPPAVSGPYWFFVFLVVLGFGLASQNWTWCSVHWAVDPTSPFHLPVTEKTCACVDDTFRGCKPVGELSQGYFRVLDKFR